MGYQPRFADKFENASGSVSYVFPEAEYEWQTQQGLRVPSASLVGAHYDLDLLGTTFGLKRSARETIRCVILEASPSAVDAEADDMRTKLYTIGLGKLYAIDSASVRRWAWSRLTAMPQFTWRAGDIFTLGTSLEFRRDSDWFGTTLTQHSEVINASPDTFVVANAGNAHIFDAIITIKGTFTNPIVTNTSNAYTFSSTRDGTLPGHWLRINCGTGAVEFSTDSGATWANDRALFSRGATQVQYMILEPGNNNIEVTGCNGATVLFEFYPAFN